MPPLVDRTGIRYGRLIVIERVGREGKWHAVWLCRCDCGNLIKVPGNRLAKAAKLERHGTRSCGCYARELHRTHGLSRIRLYKLWQHVKDRCMNPRNQDWKYYGGKGVRMWEPWQTDAKAFCDYISSLPGYGDPKLTLDRINGNAGYEPGNLRWATWNQQRTNRSKK